MFALEGSSPSSCIFSFFIFQFFNLLFYFCILYIYKSNPIFILINEYHSKTILLPSINKKKQTSLTAEVGDGDNDNSHNQTVQGESLSENQHQNHTDEDLLLLTTSANTGISSNTNGQTGSQARQTAAKTGSQVTKTVEARVVGSLRGRSLN